MRILGIDPGYAIVGFGVLQAARGQATLLCCGAIRTAAGVPMPQRLLQIGEMTRRLLQLAEVPRPDDAADAVAIALCHARSATSRLPGR